MKKKKLWLWIVAAIVVLVGGGFYLLNGGGADKVTYRFEKVSRGDVLVSISATGTLNAVTTVLVGSQVSGTIDKLYVDFNSTVKEGQLLAQLDPTFLQAAVNEQRANVDRATAQVNEAQRNFDRSKELSDKSLISQADMDAATTTLESAKASLAQAVASLDRAKVNLQYATIRAPISGVVISRDVDVGQTVAASLSAPTLFTIAQDLRKMQVEASVDEADIGNVKEEQRVTFRVDAFPEEEFVGVVSQVRLKPIVNQNVVTYVVIISVENPTQKLMPGMTATVSIEVAKSENVLRVPLQALRFTPSDEELEKLAAEVPGSDSARTMGGDSTLRERRRQGGGERRRAEGMSDSASGRQRRTATMARVWKLVDGKLQPVMIRKGIQDSRYVEVFSQRLNEGDEIIVGTVGGVTTTATTTTSQNPFMPQQQQRGGGGGRRGF
ncbi:MAG: efflux RND transporter periplasmic adaptor subunit [Bacteroidota bacterium]